MGLIYAASAQPQLPTVGEHWLDTMIKKAGHMLGYGLLASLYMRALRTHGWLSTRLRWLSWGMAIFYALTDEYHQHFVPGRNGTIVDVGIDGVGAGVAMLLHHWLQQRETRSHRDSAAE